MSEGKPGAKVAYDKDLPPKYVEKCERWREYWDAVLNANTTMMVQQGCQCQECTDAKSAGFSSAILQRYLEICLDSFDPAEVRAIVNEHVTAYLEQLIEARALMDKSNAPTTTTTQ